MVAAVTVSKSVLVV